MINIENSIDINTLKGYISLFAQKKILVIGDLMLDHYLWGQVERISPEAPVPIVDIVREEYRLGGAANVVNNILSLGAQPVVIGVVGDDNFSQTITQIFADKGASSEFVVSDKSRSTTVKSRLFASGQQIMRYDIESCADISPDIENEVIEKIDIAIESADALILEDYNKGLLTDKTIKHSIAAANKRNIPITVDPKYHRFFHYRDCTVFKPNFAELQKNLNIHITNDTELHKAANDLLARIACKYLLVTLGERGLKIFSSDGNIIHIPTFAREVFDVSGAGDTVISVITLCLSVGLDIETSAIIANHAAGAVCGKRGIHPANVEDILVSIQNSKMKVCL